MFTKIREFVNGYKTYITAVIAVVTAVVAWSASEINGQALVVAIFAALQTVFIRAGVAKSAKDIDDIVEKAVDDLYQDLKE